MKATPEELRTRSISFLNDKESRYAYYLEKINGIYNNMKISANNGYFHIEIIIQDYLPHKYHRFYKEWYEYLIGKLKEDHYTLYETETAFGTFLTISWATPEEKTTKTWLEKFFEFFK